MGIGQGLLPSEEFHKAVLEAAREFYGKTGVRVLQVGLGWTATMGGGVSPTDIDVKMES